MQMEVLHLRRLPTMVTCHLYCELAMSIAYNQNDIFLIITENKGIVPNLSEGMMLEVACRVGINGQSRFVSRKQVLLRRGCWKDSMRMKN